MSAPLTDESYARAALTYLAEPADRWLGPLIKTHGAAQTLDAIKLGRLLPLPAGTGTAPDIRRSAPDSALAAATSTPAGSGGEHADWAAVVRPGGAVPRGVMRVAMQRAMERWRVRLTELPSPEEIIGYRGAGIRLTCPGDPEWPGQLADLGDDQPYALWLRGNADLRFSCLRSVAIVGSRAATGYGSFVAAEFAASVAARGWAVVSGGAYGVDAAAHRGALSADGVTVAVLACGVDVPYPAGHADLFDAIAAQGVIVSEWPPGRTVTRLRFLVRNRVIAALATGTLVVEAAQRSGAVNTARHARDLGRRLMAVPGPITSELSAGCHQVIRDWQGTLVASADQVLGEVSAVIAAPMAMVAPTAGIPSGAAGSFGGPEVPVPPPVLDRDRLDHQSAKVLDAMPARAGLGTTRIAQRAGVTPGTALRCLGELASGGFVERCEEGWRLRRIARSTRRHPPPARPDASATSR